MEKSIKIAGGGLSGMTAAINLAKAGYDVEVYEKNKKVGQRFYGDFQGLENWTKEEDILESLRKMNIKKNFPAKPFKKGKIGTSSLDWVEVRDKKPIFYIVKRGRFKGTIDYGVYTQAKKAGVKFKFGRGLEDGSADIIATGPKYCDGIAKGITFKTDIPDCAYMLVDKKAAPGGYAYFLVVNKSAVISTCIFSHHKEINSAFKDALRKFKTTGKFKIMNKKDFGGYVSFFLQSSAKKWGRPVVGEAAGFQDYFLGYGMRYAITSGYFAAESIIKNKDYDKLWKKEFGDLLDAGISNRFMYEKFPYAETRLVELLSKTLMHRSALRLVYSKTTPNKILLPIAKLMMENRKKCNRGCACTWCRDKEQEIGE